MLAIPKDFRWPSPWALIVDEASHLGLPGARASISRSAPLAKSLSAELQREVVAGHPLKGVTCVAIGFNKDDENEFLFATNHPDYPLAVVRLTWMVEKSPRWPRAQSLAMFADFERHVAEANASATSQ